MTQLNLRSYAQILCLFYTDLIVSNNKLDGLKFKASWAELSYSRVSYEVSFEICGFQVPCHGCLMFAEIFVWLRRLKF
jgi:hypothetical protein